VTLNIRGSQKSEPEPEPPAPAPTAARGARRPLADDVLAELTSWQSRLRMAAFQAWAHETLSIVHLSVLAALEADGTMSMTKLAETMDVSVASATGIVTRMEKRGVVRRRHAEDDRRVVLVEITSAGAKVSKVMEAHRNERLRKVLAGLTDQELGSFLFGLRALGAARMRLHDAEEAATAHAKADPLADKTR
jgi:MarR family transcriptional regulator, lower aerobic nicotinate degradation pathway regulator